MRRGSDRVAVCKKDHIVAVAAQRVPHGDAVGDSRRVRRRDNNAAAFRDVLKALQIDFEIEKGAHVIHDAGTGERRYVVGHAHRFAFFQQRIKDRAIERPETRASQIFAPLFDQHLNNVLAVFMGRAHAPAVGRFYPRLVVFL